MQGTRIDLISAAFRRMNHWSGFFLISQPPRCDHGLRFLVDRLRHRPHVLHGVGRTCLGPQTLAPGGTVSRVAPRSAAAGRAISPR